MFLCLMMRLPSIYFLQWEREYPQYTPYSVVMEFNSIVICRTVSLIMKRAALMSALIISIIKLRNYATIIIHKVTYIIILSFIIPLIEHNPC